MPIMPKYEDAAFLEKYRPEILACYNAICKQIHCGLYLGLWWSVTLCVLWALSVNYICTSFNIFPVEVHGLYVIICKRFADLLEHFSGSSIKHSRTRLILDRANNELYLLRHYLLIKNRVHFPFNVFLHKFMKGDEDDIHDHPWGFFHIVLSGGYWEHVTVHEDGETLDEGTKRVWRPPGHWKIATSKYKHKIELGAEKPWTIFIPFRKSKVNQPWGFWTPPTDNSTKKWTKMDHVTYLADKAKCQ